MLDYTLRECFDAAGRRAIRSSVIVGTDYRTSTHLYETTFHLADATLLINTGQAAAKSLQLFHDLKTLQEEEAPDFVGNSLCDVDTEILMLKNRLGYEEDAWDDTMGLIRFGLTTANEHESRAEVFAAVDKKLSIFETPIDCIKTFGLSTKDIDIRWILNLLLLKLKTLISLQNMEDKRHEHATEYGPDFIFSVPAEVIHILQQEEANPLSKNETRIMSKVRNDESLQGFVDELQPQALDMVKMIDNMNPFFWAIFRSPTNYIRSQVKPTVTISTRHGKREAQLALQRLYVPFLEAPGVMEWLDQHLFGSLLSDEECLRRQHPEGEGFKRLEWPC